MLLATIMPIVLFVVRTMQMDDGKSKDHIVYQFQRSTTEPTDSLMMGGRGHWKSIFHVCSLEDNILVRSPCATEWTLAQCVSAFGRRVHPTLQHPRYSLSSPILFAHLIARTDHRRQCDGLCGVRSCTGDAAAAAIEWP